jgi:hypothetical protein
MMRNLMIISLIALAVSGGRCDRSIKECGIIAYPVPFNPDRQVLNIAYTGAPAIIDSVHVDIFDLNGDDVFTGDYGSFTSPILWNGRNSGGVIAEAGDYIIKVIIKNTQTGLYSECLVDIVIQR